MDLIAGLAANMCARKLQELWHDRGYQAADLLQEGSSQPLQT
jgi:hypothetical protein